MVEVRVSRKGTRLATDDPAAPVRCNRRLSKARRRAAFAAAAATMGLLAGCGGESGRAPVREVSTPAVVQAAGTAHITDPARARYVQAVDRVCSRYNPRRERAVSEAEGAPDVTRAVAAYDNNIGLAEAQLRGVEAITVPASDRGLIQHNVVDRLRQRLALRRALRTDLQDSDASRAQQDRAHLDASLIALEAFARGYGFRVCGSR